MSSFCSFTYSRSALASSSMLIGRVGASPVIGSSGSGGGRSIRERTMISARGSLGIMPFWVRSGSFSPTTRSAVSEAGRGGGALLRSGRGSGSSMRGGGLLRGASRRGGGLRSSCGGGRQEAEKSFTYQPSAVCYSPATDCNLCRSPLPDRKAGSCGSQSHHSPPYCRERAHRGSGSHDKWRQAY